jgi:NitT/TauT family transport system substrate-binding protein
VAHRSRPAARPARRRSTFGLAVLATLAVFVVAACGFGATPAPANQLTVGLGFIPSVQFAPFYLADRAGYYRNEGLAVTFQNKIDPELITLVGRGTVDLGIADGTSVIPAVSQGIPIRYIATVYATNPSIVFAKASSGITSPADLAGTSVGIPGRYGSSWIVLQALLDSADLSVDDVEIIEYPDFTQRAAVQAGEVQAATGFANNEPVQLQLGGETPVVLHVDEFVALPGPGIIVGEGMIQGRRDVVAAFIRATLRAMAEIVEEPDTGLEAAIAAVPELGQDRATQSAVLRATVEVWQSDLTRAEGLGTIDRTGWEESIDYMTGLDLVPNPVTPDDLVDDSFLPAN